MPIERHVTVQGRAIRLTNLDREVFPGEGITKGDVVDYYQRIAPLMLPHLQGRLLTVVRYRAGIGEPGFFQKDAGAGTPPWVHTATVPKAGGKVRHIVCDDEATLVWLANQNALVFHVSPARVPHIGRPDWLVIDLDPEVADPGVLRTGARLAREQLAERGLAAVIKTSGSKGVHVIAPLDGSRVSGDVRQLGHDIAEAMVAAQPGLFTLEFSKAERNSRVFVDVLRNRPAQTLVAPWSLRALPGAPISAPLRWSELDRPDFGPRQVTLASVFRRVAQMGDPWAEQGVAPDGPSGPAKRSG